MALSFALESSLRIHFLTGGHISRLHLTKRIGLLSCFVALGYLLFMGGIPFLNIDEMSQYPFSHYLGFFSQLGGISITLSFLWLGTYQITARFLPSRHEQLRLDINFRDILGVIDGH